MISRYAEQFGRYAEQLKPELLRIATNLAAMRSSQAIFGVSIGRYVHTYLDIYQAPAHLLWLSLKPVPIAPGATGPELPTETESKPIGFWSGSTHGSGKVARLTERSVSEHASLTRHPASHLTKPVLIEPGVSADIARVRLPMRSHCGRIAQPVRRKPLARPFGNGFERVSGGVEEKSRRLLSRHVRPSVFSHRQLRNLIFRRLHGIA